VRFVDSPSVSRQVHVAAAPETVWAICTDLARFGEWSPENRGGTWVDGADRAALGARFLGTQEHPGRGTWQTTCEVAVFEAPRRFEWVLGDLAEPGATWGFELEAESGGTRVRQYVRMGPGPSGITDVIAAMPDREERIIARRMQEYEIGIDAVLGGIKAAAEQGARP